MLDESKVKKKVRRAAGPMCKFCGKVCCKSLVI